MSILTSNLILQKTRLDNLNHVKKLNACGVQVDDIKVLSSCPNVEICSLSANCIYDLTPFVDCPQLKELYLRKNNISELHQVLYLTGAPNLRVLRLSENPIADHPDYRAYTIAALSNLVSFDDVDVTDDERFAAESEFMNILDDIRALPTKEASPRANPTLAQAPAQGRRSSSFEREPASARLPPKQSGFPQQQDNFSHQQGAAVGAGARNSGYNGDDVPIGGGGPRGGQSAGLRRAQSDVAPRHTAAGGNGNGNGAGYPTAAPYSNAAEFAPAANGAMKNRKLAQKPPSAAPRDLPALEQQAPQQSAKDVAMVGACTSLMNELSPEGLIAVKNHLARLGL